MAEPRNCANCYFWTRQGPALASAVRDPSMSLFEGSCGAQPPHVVTTAFGAVAYFPVTHESRSCAGWDPLDHPDGDGGESAPVPADTVIAFERRAA
jgi:hypothetical protein